MIIYSGFDNFSYAQKAIHYGVEEYLLKPIDEEKLERAISDVMQRRQMRSLRDKTQSRSRLLRRCLESIAPGVRQDAQRTGSGGEDEQQFLSGAAECTLFMLAVPGEREICETQWRVRLTERAPYAQQLDADGRLTILEEKSAAGSVRRRSFRQRRTACRACSACARRSGVRTTRYRAISMTARSARARPLTTGRSKRRRSSLTAPTPNGSQRRSCSERRTT